MKQGYCFVCWVTWNIHDKLNTCLITVKSTPWKKIMSILLHYVFVDYLICISVSMEKISAHLVNCFSTLVQTFLNISDSMKSEPQLSQD